MAQREACVLAGGAVRKAIAHHETLADAQVAEANWQLSCEWNWDEAERAFRRAIDLNPGSVVAHQYYGRNLGQNAGRSEDALAELEKAKALDPLSSIVDGYTSQVHLYARQYDRADEVLRAALTINPDHVLLHHNLGELRLAQGRWGEAVGPLERSVQGGQSQAEREFWQAVAGGKYQVTLPSEDEWEKAARGGFPAASPLPAADTVGES